MNIDRQRCYVCSETEQGLAQVGIGGVFDKDLRTIRADDLRDQIKRILLCTTQKKQPNYSVPFTTKPTAKGCIKS